MHARAVLSGVQGVSRARGCASTVGRPVEILGLGETFESVCTAVEVFHPSHESGEAGQNVGLLLRGINADVVDRGQVVAASRSVRSQQTFRGEVYVLSKEEGGRHKPFFNGYQSQIFFRTTNMTGAIHLPDEQEIVMPGDSTVLYVELGKAVAFNVGSHFAICEGGKTIGSGAITEVID